MVHRLPNLNRAGRDAAPQGLGEARPSGTESRRHGARGIAERRSRAPNGCETRRDAGLGFLNIPDESAGAYDKTGAMIKPCLLDIKAFLRLCHVHALEVSFSSISSAPPYSGVSAACARIVE